MTYEETVRPPWWIYAVVLGLTALLSFNFAALITVPVATVAFLIVGAGMVWLVGRMSLLVRVDDQQLHVGGNSLSRSRIAAVTPLDAEALRDAAGAKADVRARMILRTLSTPEGVRIDLTDGDEPYWLLSSKRATELAAALES